MFRTSTRKVPLTPPKKTSLDANLANNSSITLINPYMHTYSNVEAIMVRNTV